MERLEKNAIEILHMMCERSECIICDSGGKDSSVLKHIALQAKEKYGLKNCNKWSTGLKVFKWWMEDDNMDGQLAFDMEGAIYEEYT